MKFSQSLIEEIKNKTALSGVISKNVKLTQKGNEFLGLCPFHKEKTPSFTVSDDKGFYHCFGCQAHGNVIDYLMKTNGSTFQDTILMLAKDLGITINDNNTSYIQKNSKYTRLSNLIQEVSMWFCDQLNSEVGLFARRYIISRGISEDIIDRFKLGFAPNGWNNLKNSFINKGYSEQDLIDIGVLINSDNSKKSYDRYRNRLIFPIKSSNGKVIGFGGRALDDAKAKYINSPETELYNKGSNLYGLYESKSQIIKSKKLIVVEGYFDALSLSNAGFEYSIATLGTALTEKQMELIWNLSNEPIICLDGDNAGRRATFLAAERALPFLKPGFTLQFAILPFGYDPDTMIAKLGIEEFRKVIQNSLSLSELIWIKEKKLSKLNTPERQSGFFKRINDLTNRINDKNVRSLFKNAYKTKFSNEFSFSNGSSFIRDRSLKNTMNNSNYTTSSKNILKSSLINDGEHLAREKFIVAAVIKYPKLLEKGDESFGKIVFYSKELDDCRSKILKATSENLLNSDEIIKILDQSGLGKLTINLLKSAEKSHSSFFEGEFRQEILVAWQEAVALNERAALQREIDNAWKDYTENSSDSAKSRLLRLQEELGIKFGMSTRGNLINN
ncbi:MAG: DNA primase [Alphaproteobacteria bacterium MarineAlpha2_Bin1]|nr:MAG: DNA primase [Alphaproteobacteria bacterium MarineAlpha2_Bin1]